VFFQALQNLLNVMIEIARKMGLQIILLQREERSELK
jgi:hypothetical protein